MKKVVKILSLTLVLLMIISNIYYSKIQAANTSVRVRPVIHYQTIDGWGTSLSWWATQVGGWSASNRQAIMDLIFGQNGLGLNIVRYNIPGGDNPNCAYNKSGKPHQHEARFMPGFEPSQGVWDWNADASQLWILSQAKTAYGVNQFEAFCNSPPYWMTQSGCSSGSANGNDDNLASNMYSTYADYLTEVVKHIRDVNGVAFNYLEPFNEPVSGYWKAGGSQEGCQISRTAQASILPLVSSSLSSKGLTTKVTASDETSVDQAIDTYNSFNSSNKALITKINTHTYSGSNRFGLRDLASAASKKLWMSEYSTGYVADNHSGMAPAMPLADTIMKDVKQLGASAWTIWQPVESEKESLINLDTGAAWNPPGSWGLIHGVYSGFTAPNGTIYTKEQYFVSKQYYVMKQFSKFIKQGYIIVDANNDNVLVAVNPANNQLVLKL